MKTNLVVWGKKNQDERVLIAMELNVEENKVDVYSFNAETATENFVTQMFHEWKEGKSIDFPDDNEKFTLDLTASKSILPENLSSDDEALINKTQAEWHYVVLSSRMHHVYEQELSDLEEKVGRMSAFENDTWEELKNYWAKVQKQIQERALFKSHSEDLRSRTNKLFDKMKDFRKKLDDIFRQKSSENIENFRVLIGEVDKKIEKGLSLQPLFEELKNIQRDFNKTSFTKSDRGKIWDALDAAFKKLKTKRYGAETGGKESSQGTERIDRRLEGLKSAISKMEASINWDNRDLTFENRRANESEGQLESQIRQAKINMIEERISSKKLKLEDMNNTLKKLNDKREGILAKIASEEEKTKVEETKKGIEDKIRQEIKEKSAELADNEKLKKAAAQLGLIVDKVKGSAKEVLEDLQESVAEVKESVAEKIESAVEAIKERFEKEGEQPAEAKIEKELEQSAESAEGKIENAVAEAENVIEKASDKVELEADAVQENIEEAVQRVKERIENAVDNIRENTDLGIENTDSSAVYPEDKKEEQKE